MNRNPAIRNQAVNYQMAVGANYAEKEQEYIEFLNNLRAQGNDYEADYTVSQNITKYAIALASTIPITRAGFASNALDSAGDGARVAMNIGSKAKGATKQFTPYRNQSTPLNFDINTYDFVHGKLKTKITSDEFIINDGSTIIPSRRNPNGANHIIETIFNPQDGELYISWLYTANSGKGIGTELISRAIESVGPSKVKSITGEMGADNLKILNSYIKQGMSPLDAAKKTPAAAIRIKLGYGNISFDPKTNTIKGSQ